MHVTLNTINSVVQESSHLMNTCKPRELLLNQILQEIKVNVSYANNQITMNFLSGYSLQPILMI